MMFISIGIGTAVAVALIAIVSAFTGGHVTTNDGQPTSELVGKSVAKFSLVGLNARTVVSPWSHHHASVLIFFASWCGPCQGEMPKIAAYVHTHSEPGVRIIGIAANDPHAAALKFIEKDDVTFPVAYDPNSTVTAGIFQFTTLPETAFVNAKGVVTQVYFGAIPKSDLIKGIAALRAA
jgi:thiol-disulfide isomerase/thioredoxin